MWLACHKKRYLLCVKLANFGIFTKPFPNFFSKQAKLTQPHRAETADFRFQISNFEIRGVELYKNWHLGMFYPSWDSFKGFLGYLIDFSYIELFNIYVVGMS